MTDQYTWLGEPPTEPAVVMIPQAPYHLTELDRLASTLRARGVSVAFAVPVISWKPLYSLRPTVRRLAATVAASARSVTEPVSIETLLRDTRAVVVMNDWGVPRALVDRANGSGVPTFGWVEGVQDYDDVDTGLDRNAYRRVDHVFALGPASCEILGADRTTAVGSERIAQLWNAPAGPTGRGVLINSNFTYGVLVEARRSWVAGVVAACEGAEQPYVLSRHAAERGRSRLAASDRPVDELLGEAGRLVSRFSTVNLDALASGVELAYHNPHGEQVAMFADPQEGFAHTSTVEELRAVLSCPPRPRHEVREAARAYLERHVLLDASSTPADRAAEVIVDRIG